MRNKPSFPYLAVTPTEEKVLRYLLSAEKQASISEIARAVNLTRTSIYNAITSLKAKGLIAQQGFLYSIVSSQLQKYSKKSTAPREQIKALLSEVLTLQRGEVVYSVESDEEIQWLLKNEQGLPEWQKAIAKKGVVLKSIGSTGMLKVFQSIISKELGAHIKQRSGAARFTGEPLLGTCTLVAFRDSVIFFSRKKAFFFRIDNPDAAILIKSSLELLYAQLRYYPLIVSK